jgi:hypothetical protein
VGVGVGACVCGWRRGQRVVRAISRAVRGQRRRSGREEAGGLGGKYTGAGGSEVDPGVATGVAVDGADARQGARAFKHALGHSFRRLHLTATRGGAA